MRMKKQVVQLVAPHRMPKLGRGGSLQILHSLVHIESWAIDLSWDLIARFGKAAAMPRDFFDDFVKVAEEEGRYFRLLAARLIALGSSYGALPAHDGLWDSAEATSKDLAARLAIEHHVHTRHGAWMFCQQQLADFERVGTTLQLTCWSLWCTLRR